MITPDAPGVVVSYPKSGRTCLRYMLNTYWSLITNTPVDNIYELSAPMRDEIGMWWLHLGGEFSTHLSAMGDHTEAPFGAAQHATLLVRNIHQTLVSCYHWLAFRLRAFDGSPSAFIRDPDVGVRKIIAFYNRWESHWSRFPASTDIITYESLCADRRAALERLIRNLGFPVDAKRLDRAARDGSFDSMREAGDTPAYAGSALAPSDPHDPRTRKVRKADPLEYLAVFKSEDLAYIDAAVHRELENTSTEYTLELVTPPAQRMIDLRKNLATQAPLNIDSRS